MYQCKFVSGQILKNMGHDHFSYFKVCPPLHPVNPLYCILILSIYTICVSGKLIPGGGTYFEIENGDDHIVYILAGNKNMFL